MPKIDGQSSSSSRNEKTYPPTFGMQGNTAATLKDVQYCYNLMLGRNPENLSVTNEAKGQPIHSLIKGMLSSSEFAAIVKRFMSDKSVPHSSLGVGPSDDMLFWINDHLVLDRKFHQQILSASNWLDFLKIILSRPELMIHVDVEADQRASMLEAIPDPMSEAVNRTQAQARRPVGECSSDLPEEVVAHPAVEDPSLSLVPHDQLFSGNDEAREPSQGEFTDAADPNHKMMDAKASLEAPNESQAEVISTDPSLNLSAARADVSQDTSPAEPRSDTYVVSSLDECTAERVQGWTSSKNSTNTPIVMQVLVDGEPLFEVDCDLPRPDLAMAGYPIYSGYKFQLPRRFLDGAEHELQFAVSGELIHVHVKGELQQAYKFRLTRIAPVRGNVDGFDKGVIKGWACVEDDESGSLRAGLAIQVSCNGERIALVKANRFRPDVAQSLGADPYCGFIFEPPPMFKRTSPVQFHFHAVPGNVEIANSPCSTSFGRDHREGKILSLQDVVDRLSDEIGRLKQDLQSLISRRHHSLSSYDEWFREYLPALRSKVEFERLATPMGTSTPLVSVLCPTYKPDLNDFRAAVESVLHQTYRNWELIIVDDGSNDPALDAYVRKVIASDERVKFLKPERNSGISGATNVAIAAAQGEWIALFDHDDLLVDVALEVMIRLAVGANAKFVYSDEDKIDPHGYFSEPALKPDWNYRLLLSSNYVCHLAIIRSDVLTATGPLNSAYDGAQDHELFLRISEHVKAHEILHVPEILYHWRKTANSTASSIGAKSYAIEAGRNAIADHLKRKGLSAVVSSVMKSTMYEVSWQMKEEPSVHIVIPFKDQAAMTKRCIDAITQLTKYNNYKITLVDNWSIEPETAVFLKSLEQDPRITVLRVEEEFNYSKLNNDAVQKNNSEFIFLMNNDLIVLHDDWLNVVVSEALADPEVGVVGGKFLYPNGNVQHAGVILGLWGVAGHVHTGIGAEAPGYMARAILAQELSAVTAAGMLIRSAVYNHVSGLDEQNLKVAFNDIDFCLKVRSANYKVVWTPVFRAEHHESLSRGHDTQAFKKARFYNEMVFMQRKWGKSLEHDPHYSRFFDLYGEPYSDLIDAETES